MDAYERIAGIIRYLDQHRAEQPGLAALASQAGISEYQLHRLFARWVGVTPKDFLQCLTLACVKDALRRGQSVLDAALDAGLSGPGRLHDLCVTLEAASPGEMKSGGSDWTIVAGYGASPFGTCLLGESPRGTCHFSFIDAGMRERAWEQLQADWPRARLRRDDAAARRVIGKIFERNGAPSSGGSPLRAFVRGTAFQVRVWRALLRVPPGRLVSYRSLARAAGVPSAVRAVGTAVGQNPVACLIPCHRVIRETGVLGEYRWGSERKKVMVAWEANSKAG